VSLWLVPLPIADTSARRRFVKIRNATDELKRGGHAMGGAVIAEVANWAGGAVVEATARAVGSARIYNLIVTNVPGPAVSLYLAGSRMREAYPHLPLFERQGIGIALLSYTGGLHVCIGADWGLGDFLARLAERIDVALRELAAAADVELDATGAADPPARLRPAPLAPVRVSF
jgi:diacylglycerol O-acyltransferase / wax synthase